MTTIRSRPRLPSQYRRRVLLAVVGTSPQVITETVYANAVAAGIGDRFEPTEVHVVTTSAGAALVVQQLLQGGVWQRLLADHRLPPISFNDSHIHVVRDSAGQLLQDIRSDADNACVADAITEKVRAFTGDDGCALHVSLAGGRKTMGYYAGYALSLFGRPQDRLSHVLVDAAYESTPDFFYPTLQPHALRSRDGSTALDASRAVVQLAQIPFVLLRSLLPATLLSKPSSFAEVVAAARTPPAPKLILDIISRQATMDDVPLRLAPAQFALLTVLAHRARHSRPPLKAPPKDAHDETWAQEVLADLRSAVGVMAVDSRFEQSIRKDCSGAKLSPHVSRLRKSLTEHVGAARVHLYLDDGDTHRHKRYSVPLAPDAIEIIRPPGDCKLAKRSGAA